MTSGSIIQSVAGQQVKTLEDLGVLLRHPDNLGRTVDITWIDADRQTITRPVPLPAAPEPNRGILGVGVTPLSPDPQAVLDRYQGAFSTNPLALLLPPTMQQGAVPYSDLMAPRYTSSIFGSSDYFAPVANILFWLWFINFNVGIFNALPIGPLDGGQLYGAMIENKAKSKILAKNASMMLTLAMTAVVVASLLLPYIIF
jgi:membrane-associated protease RseP (regulator of RpoE activity)